MQPMEDQDGADNHTTAHGGPCDAAGGCVLMEAAACGEPVQEQAPGRSCNLWRGVHTGAHLLAGTEACGEPRLDQSVPEGLYPIERTHGEAIREGLYPMGDPR
ncbi:zinc finger and BTB domain-containing protein 5 [Grus japonensis]|uniref:Zinc finger and BTB domain-containing protein 5 n=1 Tax=Grus japonensis TaxID=30415 RepID=A0ABC9Y3F5_GRUJA